MSAVLDDEITLTEEEKELLSDPNKLTQEKRRELYTTGEKKYAVWIQLDRGSGILLQDREKYSKMGAMIVALGMQKSGRMPKVKLWTEVPEEQRVPDIIGMKIPQSKHSSFAEMMRDPELLAEADALLKNVQDDERPLWK